MRLSDNGVETNKKNELSKSRYHAAFIKFDYMLENPRISEYRCLEVQLPNMVKISDRCGQSAGNPIKIDSIL